MAKILLVEDNEMNRDVLFRLLSRRGQQVVFAEDGEAAIDRAMARDRGKAFEAGCSDFETKPVEFPRLLAKIAAYLGGIQA